MPVIDDAESPNASWSLDRLTQYTVVRFSAIQSLSHHTAVQTYRVGAALYFAQMKLLGRWQQWLSKNDLNYQTARQAIRLYEECPTETDLEGLNVTEAKIKFGIYSDFSRDLPPGASRRSGGGSYSGGSSGGASHCVPEANGGQESRSPEQLLSLCFHRLKGGLEIVDTLPWTSDLLYTEEVTQAEQFCRALLKRFKALKQKYPEPPRVRTAEGLDELETI